MGRKKIEIKYIPDEKSRLVTFAKRRAGLFKKAYELSVLCECEIALLVFTRSNRLYQYASDSMEHAFQRYKSHPRANEFLTNPDIKRLINRQATLNDCTSNQMDTDCSECSTTMLATDDEVIDKQSLEQTYNAKHVSDDCYSFQCNESLQPKLMEIVSTTSSTATGASSDINITTTAASNTTTVTTTMTTNNTLSNDLLSDGNLLISEVLPHASNRDNFNGTSTRHQFRSAINDSCNNQSSLISALEPLNNYQPLRHVDYACQEGSLGHSACSLEYSTLISNNSLSQLRNPQHQLVVDTLGHINDSAVQCDQKIASWQYADREKDVHKPALSPRIAKLMSHLEQQISPQQTDLDRTGKVSTSNHFGPDSLMPITHQQHLVSGTTQRLNFPQTDLHLNPPHLQHQLQEAELHKNQLSRSDNNDSLNGQAGLDLLTKFNYGMQLLDSKLSSTSQLISSLTDKVKSQSNNANNNNYNDHYIQLLNSGDVFTKVNEQLRPARSTNNLNYAQSVVNLNGTSHLSALFNSVAQSQDNPSQHCVVSTASPNSLTSVAVPVNSGQSHSNDATIASQKMEFYSMDINNRVNFDNVPASGVYNGISSHDVLTNGGQNHITDDDDNNNNNNNSTSGSFNEGNRISPDKTTNPNDISISDVNSAHPGNTILNKRHRLKRLQPLEFIRMPKPNPILIGQQQHSPVMHSPSTVGPPSLQQQNPKTPTIDSPISRITTLLTTPEVKRFLEQLNTETGGKCGAISSNCIDLDDCHTQQLQTHHPLANAIINRLNQIYSPNSTPVQTPTSSNVNGFPGTRPSNYSNTMLPVPANLLSAALQRNFSTTIDVCDLPSQTSVLPKYAKKSKYF